MLKDKFIKKYNLIELKEYDGFVIDLIYATDKTMKEYDFTPNPYEWWHFDDSNNFDVIREIFDEYSLKR